MLQGTSKLLLSGFVSNQAIGENSQSGIRIAIGIYSQSGCRGEFPIGLSGFLPNRAIGVYFQSGSHFMNSNCLSGYRGLFPIGLSGFIPNRAIWIYSQSGYRGFFSIWLSGFLPNRAIGVYSQSGSLVVVLVIIMIVGLTALVNCIRKGNAIYI